MTEEVTLLTASLPERKDLLAEAVASVAAQTVHPVVHLVGIDHAREGAATVYNRLAGMVDTPWVTFLDDDDLLDPNHLETLLDNCGGCDVVYTWCRAVGHNFRLYNQPFDRKLLFQRSIVPITAMVRTEFYARAEWMRHEDGYDWRFWQRVANAGATFRCVPEITWTYRRHELGNQSHGELVIAGPRSAR